MKRLMLIALCLASCSSEHKEKVYTFEDEPVEKPATQSQKEIESLKGFTIGFANAIHDISDSVASRISRDDTIATVCIEGHTYYKYHNCIAPKLESNGDPVRCTGNFLPVK